MVLSALKNTRLTGKYLISSFGPNVTQSHIKLEHKFRVAANQEKLMASFPSNNLHVKTSLIYAKYLFMVRIQQLFNII